MNNIGKIKALARKRGGGTQEQKGLLILDIIPKTFLSFSLFVITMSGQSGGSGGDPGRAWTGRTHFRRQGSYGLCNITNLPLEIAQEHATPEIPDTRMEDAGTIPD